MIHSILANVRRCIALQVTEEALFLSLLQECRFKKRDELLRIGEVCREQYYVVKGCLKVFYMDEQGNEHIAKFAVEDWWAFDIESFFQGTPAFYGITCLEDAVLLGLSRESHERLLTEIPSFEKFYRLMLQNSFIALQHRTMQNISMSAQDRYEQFQKKYPGLERRISQKNIAAYLGITPVFLSVLRREEMYKH
jgi:CRP-like cAMP-binding protein